MKGKSLKGIKTAVLLAAALTITMEPVNAVNAQATATETTADIMILENGDYIETTITSNPVYRKPNRAAKSITKTKTELFHSIKQEN